DTGIAHRGEIALAVAVVLAALAFMGVMWLRWDRNKPAMRLVRACALLLACYVGVVLTSRLLADPRIPFDERILSPALLLVMVLLAVTISAWWRHTRRSVARVAVGVMLAVWWVAAAGATRHEARYALDWGSDFAGQQWRASE